jgi:pyruvate ferredoxin oxidoreductase gamma subunit
MGELTEIRIEGRGGQGNVVAAYMLARAAFEDGRFAQAFPSFGPERRGAPVSSFVRISEEPIKRRCQIREPQYVIIQDPSLLHVPNVCSGIHADGGVLVNSSKEVERSRFPGISHVTTIPATSMALRMLGEPIPNVALLAAFLTLTDLVPLAALEKVLAHRFHGEELEHNLRLIREASSYVARSSWKDQGSVAAN